MLDLKADKKDFMEDSLLNEETAGSLHAKRGDESRKVFIVFSLTIIR